jgi:hypothetical protein
MILSCQLPKRFRAKHALGLDPGWIPARAEKTRQKQKSETGPESIGIGRASNPTIAEQ